MNGKSLAEHYEYLKEQRRRAATASDLESELASVARDHLQEQGQFRQKLMFVDTNVLVRFIEIYTLVSRVFGSDRKADVWLGRPNSSLGGQAPIDLLKDELGTAVVRETLEQIDHGIFA